MLHFASEGQEKNEKSPEDTYRHSDRFMNGFQAKGIFYVSAWSYIYIYIFFFNTYIFKPHSHQSNSSGRNFPLDLLPSALFFPSD